jgi:hypothetical protein
MASQSASVHHLDTSQNCHCRFRKSARAHHDQLLRLLTDADSMLDLFELAVSWGELDYSATTVISPNWWVEFARQHSWADAARAERAFSLATDIAMGAQRMQRAAIAAVAGGR